MRKALVAVGLVGVLLLAACHPLSDYQSSCPGSGTIQRYLIDRVNTYRYNHGVNKLFCNSYAQSKAQKHSEAMARAGTTWHTTLENGYPSSADWGHRYWCWLGEDVGASYWQTGQDDNQIAEDIFQLWIGSATHRNILMKDEAMWIGAGEASAGTTNNVYMYAALELGVVGDSPGCDTAGASAASSTTSGDTTGTTTAPRVTG
jgi:uncharacterized protein YkwD